MSFILQFKDVSLKGLLYTRYCHAYSYVDRLTLLMILTSAPDLMSAFTTSKWPFQAAECKEVDPFCMKIALNS